MLNLFDAELPATIEVNGSSFYIQTDFRYLIRFIELLETKSKLIDFLFMFPYEKPADLQAGVYAIIKWMNPKEEIPRLEDSASLKILDYKVDADYIYSAFLEQYGIDLMDLSVKLHWYKFQALLKSLHDVKLCEIMGYRAYEPTAQNYDRNKELLRLRTQWELPQPADEQTDEALNYFDSLLK